MKIIPKSRKLSELEADTLNLFLWEDESPEKITGFPRDLILDIKKAIARENFKGGSGEILILSTLGKIAAYKLIITGLGRKSDFDRGELARIIAESVSKSKESKAVKAGFVISDEWNGKYSFKNTIQTIVEAIYLADYRFLKYKSETERKKSRNLEEVFLSVSNSQISQAEEGINLGTIMSKATIYSRDLINEPPQITTPTYLADEAVKLGKKSGGAIKVSVLGKAEIEKLGMNAFLGVARGSDEEAKFIILKYRNGRANKKIALVGKGITFDTGGLSLKSAQYMETMKLDMSGAAAVLGVFSALSEFKPSAEVIGLIPACENMPSGRALKPGDILTAMNGKTIEVLNTDAEGRLTLADALSYALIKEKPDIIIDLATLTGACMVALGEEVAGMFGNDEKLLAQIEKVSKETGENLWRLPLEKRYSELIKSKIADVKNISASKYGGAITAALFLQKFVDKTPWVHLDIAGPAFMEKDTPLIPAGGAGFGVRLILHYINSL